MPRGTTIIRCGEKLGIIIFKNITEIRFRPIIIRVLRPVAHQIGYSYVYLGIMIGSDLLPEKLPNQLQPMLEWATCWNFQHGEPVQLQIIEKMENKKIKKNGCRYSTPHGYGTLLLILAAVAKHGLRPNASTGV